MGAIALATLAAVAAAFLCLSRYPQAQVADQRASRADLCVELFTAVVPIRNGGTAWIEIFNKGPAPARDIALEWRGRSPLLEVLHPDSLRAGQRVLIGLTSTPTGHMPVGTVSWADGRRFRHSTRIRRERPLAVRKR